MINSHRKDDTYRATVLGSPGRIVGKPDVTVALWGLPEPGLIYEHRSRVDHSGKQHTGAILTPNAHIHAA